MQIAYEKVGDTSILVTADGNPVPHKDSEDYVLHIFPRLYAPYDDVGCDNLKLLGARVQNHDGTMIDVLPDEVLVRSPYPNQFIYIAGTAERRMGWTIPIDPNKLPTGLEFSWLYLQDPNDIINTTQKRVTHTIDLDLKISDAGHVFTTDTFFPYPQVQAYLNSRAYDQDFRPDSSIRFGEGLDYIDIYQKIELRSCAWSDRCIENFEDAVYLRDITPVKQYTTYCEAFEKAACVVMPAQVLIDAIQMSQKESFPSGVEFPPVQPSAKQLIDWWNTYAPNPKHRNAKSFEIYCRVADDDELWPADMEANTFNISSFIKLSFESAIARVGDCILILFLTTSEDSPYDLNACNGVNYTNLHVEVIRNYWWRGWDALRGFQYHFPAAHEKLAQRASEERLAARGGWPGRLH